jgi:Xaa-Pro aminopeptidase
LQHNGFRLSTRPPPARILAGMNQPEPDLRALVAAAGIEVSEAGRARARAQLAASRTPEAHADREATRDRLRMTKTPAEREAMRAALVAAPRPADAA